MSTAPTPYDAHSRKSAWILGRPSWMRNEPLAIRTAHSSSSDAHSFSQPSSCGINVPTSSISRVPLKADDQPGSKADVALRNALEIHAQRLPASERAAYLAASSMDPSVLLERVRNLDNQQAQTSRVRPWTKQLTNFLNLLDRSIGGVAIVIQANPDISSIVVGGAKLIIDIATRFAIYLDELVEMLDKISDYLPLLNKYAEYSHLPDICKALSGIYIDILDFYSTARKVYTDRNGQLKRFASLRLLLRAQWKPFCAEFGPIMSSIQHHYAVLSRSGVAELFGGQQEIRMRLQEIQAHQRSHQKEEFFAWLSAHNFELRQLDALEACHEGTACWLFDTQEFRVWDATQQSDLLWCHAGSGKSILASQVIKYIQAKQSARPEAIGVCFAYFNASDATFQGLRPLLLTFLKQMCEHQNHIPDWLTEAKGNKRDPLGSSTIENFSKITSGYQRTYIIIDGLDECRESERRPVLELISRLRQSKKVFKMFVSSRKYTDITRCLARKGVLQVTTDSKQTTNDINIFIQNKTRSLRQSQSLLVQSDSLFQEMVSTLIQKADGMFLWVTLQLEHFCTLDTDTKIRAALKQLPESLTKTYTRIVEEIDRKRPEQKALAIACFRWMLSANKVLHWTEMQTALAWSGSTTPNTLQEMFDDHSSLAYITSTCGNLVHFPRKEGATFWGQEKATFIHDSVFQFFSTHLPTLTSLSESWTILSDTRAMHRRNALDCLNLIRLKLDSIALDGSIQYQVDYTSFNYYALNHFDKHLLASENMSETPSAPVVLAQQMLKKDSDHLFCFLLMRLYLSPSMEHGLRHVPQAELNITTVPEFIIWSTQLYKLRARFPLTMSPSKLLCLLVRAGLVDAIHNLIQEGFFKDGRHDINEPENGDSAMYIACESGHSKIVKLLLQAGAWPQPDIVAPTCWIDCETPLFRATFNGHTTVVNLLLQAGVCVNVPTNLYSWHTYPLQLAEIHGRHEIAELLLAHGADRSLFEGPSATNDRHRTGAGAGAEKF